MKRICRTYNTIAILAVFAFCLSSRGADAGGLETSPSWTLAGNQILEQLGSSVASGDVNGDGYSDVIVGAVGYTSLEDGEGAVFVFFGSASGLGTTPVWRAESNLSSARSYQIAEFGYSVCTGDLNGDGYDDVIVGAPQYRNGQLEEGGVFVYYGSSAGLGPNGTPGNADWRGEGNQEFAEFGHSVSAGDVNGDGYDDLIVGVANYSNGQSYEGRVCVFHGSATGPVPNGTPTNANWWAESDRASAFFGWSVSTAGDVNGDGFDDVIIGAPYYSSGSTKGKAFLYLGSETGLGPNGIPGNADWTAESYGENEFGFSVSTAGDVNGDGYSDVLVGAPRYSGSVYAYYGSASGPGLTYNWTNAYVGGGVGRCVSMAGDVDGDGYSDVIVGAPQYTNGQYQEGAAFVYHGSAAGLSTTASWTYESDQESAQFGSSVSTAGDVNGDGYIDVIVGAPYWDTIDYNSEGAAFVFPGSLDASKPSAVSAAARRLLYPEDALPGQEDDAAFRYIRELYIKNAGTVAPDFENMSSYYGGAAFDRSLQAEAIVQSGLTNTPDDEGLWALLFDLYYHRTAAAQILAGDLLKSLDEVRLGITGFVPGDCSGYLDGPLIDLEICVLEQALEAHKQALQGGIDADTAAEGGGYFKLFQEDAEAYLQFQTLMPGRDLIPPTYWDSDTQAWLPVGGSLDPLSEGYKDLVLLFGLLRDTGRVASRLAPLYAARGYKEDAENLISSTQGLLLTQGQILLHLFPGIEDTVTPTSGEQEAITAIAGWRQALQELTTVAQVVRSGKNPLGFDEDFLIFMDKPGGSEFETLFHSYDLFEKYLNPISQPTKPLGLAIQALEDARDAYEAYQSTQAELSTQLDSLASKYKDRLEEIVGYPPDDDTYEDAKADPMANAPWGEVGQQLLSIQAARLAIERNRQEMDNLRRQVEIEVQRQGAVGAVYINYGQSQASLTEEIGKLEAAQAGADGVSDALHGLADAKGGLLVVGQVLLGVGNALIQVDTELKKAEKEGEKERLAAKEKAEVEGINSAAQIKTWLLQMNVMVIDSQEAALLLTQELARLKGLVNELSRLETGLKEASAALSRRYFADPIHRMLAEGTVKRALFSFENAQRWTFYMARALEYKWNVKFQKDYVGRTWTVADVTRLRNADELYDAYLAMDDFDSNFVYGGNSFDILSLRENVLGYLDDGQYEDPLNPGVMVDAITAFRNYLKSVSDLGGNLYIDFSTAREFPGTNLFLGPTFGRNGQIISDAYGRYVDKIDKLLVSVVGTGASSVGQLTGYLTYGGTSYIRRQRVGDFDPATDKFQNELTTYSTRFWTEDVDHQAFVSDEAQTVSVDVRVNPDSDLSCQYFTVGEVTALRERSVAASGWTLMILNPKVGGVPVLEVDKVDDIEIHICHNWKDRLAP